MKTVRALVKKHLPEQDRKEIERKAEARAAFMLSIGIATWKGTPSWN
jgi:hypothetical protein